jgi:hypothetical protein
MGYLAMDYDQIIPIAVNAVQEQQKEIDSLRNEMSNLKKLIDDSILSELGDSKLDGNRSILKQNSPNPFHQTTAISFLIAEKNFRNSSLVIFDLNGLLVKRFDIQKPGEGSIEISANELKAGMYVYTLIVNQREIDSKRMILLDY